MRARKDDRNQFWDPSEVSKVPAFMLSCPDEIFSHVLVFVGAGSAVFGLGSSSKEMRSAVLGSRELWFCLCKVTGKLADFHAPEKSLASVSSHEFFGFYRSNPCVPVDAPTVDAALKLALPFDYSQSSPTPGILNPHCSRTIFVLPGVYELSRPIVIKEPLNSSVVKIVGVNNPASVKVQHYPSPQLQPAVTIAYQTSRSNEPLLNIKKGTVLLQNLKLVHHSRGTDIWEGNTVVMVKSSVTSLPLDFTPLFSSTASTAQNPRLFAYDCSLKSTSGRGIVATSSEAYLDNVEVNECAATGVYVGRGRHNSSAFGCLAAISCDIVGNGIGGRLRPNEALDSTSYELVQAGHSGIYSQDGQIFTADCNISGNLYTGLSNTGSRAVVHMDKTDVVGNAAMGVEVADHGSGNDEQVRIAGDCNISNNEVEVETGGPRGRKRARLNRGTPIDPDGCNPSAFLGRLSLMRDEE